jgi:hypothetical protein
MKCGLQKISKFSALCFFGVLLVSSGVFGIGLKTASASIVYGSLDQFISTPSQGFSSTTYPCTATSSALGVPDNNYAYCYPPQPTAYFGANSNFISPSGLPTGAIIDAVIYSYHAYATTSNFSMQSRVSIGTLTKTSSSFSLTTTPTYYIVQYDSTNLTSAEMLQLSQSNFDSQTVNKGFALLRISGGSNFYLDSVERILWYHYDNSAILTRINSLSASPLNINVYPPVVVSTSTLTTTYFYNSADDLATSTRYTQLQYWLHDNFTNQDQYILGSAYGWTKDTTYATSTIANFCNGGAFNCYNSDTYQLYVRFSNADSSFVSAWNTTPIYFSYISNGTYNPPTTTHFNNYSYSTSTGLVGMSFTVATSDAPILLSLDEANDRDGELSGQPKYYQVPIGTSVATGTVIIPNDPTNSGTTYLTGKLVSASDNNQIYDTRLITLFLASTSASSTPAGNTGYPSYTPATCSLTNLGGCFQNALCAVFCPSSGALSVFSSFVSTMQGKPPVGYFFVVKNNLANIATSSTPVFTVVIPHHFKQYFFSPFDTAIAGILWFFFAIHFYKRLKTITI